MEYRILCSNMASLNLAITDIEQQVDYLIRNGWKPQGAANIAVDNDDYFIVSQAMIKE